MLRTLSAIAFSFCLVTLSACREPAPEKTQTPATSEPAPAVTDAETKTATLKPPTFADMINVNKPLAAVKGNYKPLTFPINIDSSMETALDSFASKSESYGIIVWHEGQVIYEKYSAPYSKSTRSESASMHKSVMSLLIGIAIKEGYINGVDANVGEYILEWADDPRGQITIRNLLEMSTGLEPLSSEGGMESAAVKFMMQGETARQTILGMALIGEPGGTFHYQNAVSQILGLILENATGKDYQDYLSEKLWKPLGANTAKVWLNEPDGFARTYSALYAEPRDWLRLGLLVKDFGKFGESQIVPESYVKSMTAPSNSNANYGWQIWRGDTYEPARFYNDAKVGFPVMSSEPFSVDDILYFDGFGGQRVYISRSQDLVIIRSGNVRMDWDDSKLPNLILSHLQTL